jgi:hypothetical protein
MGRKMAHAFKNLKPIGMTHDTATGAVAIFYFFKSVLFHIAFSIYFFNPAVKLVTTVTDWLTRCETRSRRIFLPSGKMS